jgi:chromosomal replication initiator protein
VCQKFGQCPPTYSPLVLYGPAETGKTLLTQLLASRWESQRPKSAVVIWNGQEFVRGYADAVDTNSISDFQRRLRQADLLILDGLDALANRPGAQQELLAACDAIEQRQAQVVVTSRAAPFELTNLLPGLIGRLVSGLLVPVAPPGSAARQSLLKELATQRRIPLSSEVAEQLAQRLDEIDSAQHWTVPQLEQLLTRISELLQRDPTAAVSSMVKDCLESQGISPAVTLASITAAVAKHFGLTATELKSVSRRQLIVRARGVAILLSRQLTKESLDRIGHHFGGRDHTTALHACRKTEELLSVDPMLQQAIEQLTVRLQRPQAKASQSPAPPARRRATTPRKTKRGAKDV